MFNKGQLLILLCLDIPSYLFESGINLSTSSVLLFTWLVFSGEPNLFGDLYFLVIKVERFILGVDKIRKNFLRKEF